MADSRQLDRIKTKARQVWPCVAPHIQVFAGVVFLSHADAFGSELVKIAHPRGLEALEGALDALLKPEGTVTRG